MPMQNVIYWCIPSDTSKHRPFQAYHWYSQAIVLCKDCSKFHTYPGVSFLKKMKEPFLCVSDSRHSDTTLTLKTPSRTALDALTSPRTPLNHFAVSPQQGTTPIDVSTEPNAPPSTPDSASFTTPSNKRSRPSYTRLVGLQFNLYCKL